MWSMISYGKHENQYFKHRNVALIFFSVFFFLLNLAKGRNLEANDDGSIMIFTQKIEKMESPNIMPFRVTFTQLKDKLTPEFISSHFIIVEVVTEEISCDLQDGI